MKPVHILLVEDNEGDILLTTEALNESSFPTRVTVAKDGWEAIQYLQIADTNCKELPELILLDINMPKMNGHEVLKKIKTNEKTKHIPVIMLSTSFAKNDILLSYQNFVSCYLLKPIELNGFQQVISSIEDFWIRMVKLPNC